DRPRQAPRLAARPRRPPGGDRHQLRRHGRRAHRPAERGGALGPGAVPGAPGTAQGAAAGLRQPPQPGRHDARLGPLRRAVPVLPRGAGHFGRGRRRGPHPPRPLRPRPERGHRGGGGHRPAASRGQQRAGRRLLGGAPGGATQRRRPPRGAHPLLRVAGADRPGAGPRRSLRRAPPPLRRAGHRGIASAGGPGRRRCARRGRGFGGVGRGGSSTARRGQRPRHRCGDPRAGPSRARRRGGGGGRRGRDRLPRRGQARERPVRAQVRRRRGPPRAGRPGGGGGRRRGPPPPRFGRSGARPGAGRRAGGDRRRLPGPATRTGRDGRPRRRLRRGVGRHRLPGGPDRRGRGGRGVALAAGLADPGRDAGPAGRRPGGAGRDAGGGVPAARRRPRHRRARPQPGVRLPRGGRGRRRPHRGRLIPCRAQIAPRFSSPGAMATFAEAAYGRPARISVERRGTVRVGSQDILLPTTMVGNYPNPRWYDGQAFAKFPQGEFIYDAISREAFEDAVLSIAHDQEAAGLDVISDGKVYGGDSPYAQIIYHYYERLTGYELHGPPIGLPIYSTLFAPTVTGEVRRRSPFHYATLRAVRKATNKPVKISYVGLQVLALASNDQYYKDVKDLATALAKAYHEDFLQLADEGVDIIQLDEFVWPYGMSDWETEIYNLAVDNVPGVQFWTHVCWGN